MNAITFDKDGYVRRLTDAGADERLAIAIASYGDFADTSGLATKTDVKSLSADTRAGFADVRTEMRSEFADVRTEMRTGFAELRTEMANLKASLYGSLMAAFLGVAGLNVALVFAVVRLVTPQ